ncbi:MAG: hypothetical protein SWX82_09735 [Cyanobacteriota bacterium]|nr:hypothetical protein [Cyanobacteriota bacterium]
MDFFLNKKDKIGSTEISEKLSKSNIFGRKNIISEKFLMVGYGRTHNLFLGGSSQSILHLTHPKKYQIYKQIEKPYSAINVSVKKNVGRCNGSSLQIDLL